MVFIGMFDVGGWYDEVFGVVLVVGFVDLLYICVIIGVDVFCNYFDEFVFVFEELCMGMGVLF